MNRNEFINANSLVKSLLCTGMPGSGKTNFALGLCIQLLSMGVPWTFIEGANRQARMLKSLIRTTDGPLQDALQEVRVYTTGNNSLNKMRISPFRRIEGVPLTTTLATLREWFEATFPAVPPLPQILAEAAEEMLARSGKSAPSIEPLREFFVRALRRKGYSDNLKKDLQGAFDSRMMDITGGTLGSTLCPGDGNLRVEDFFRYSQIIELNGLTEYEIGVLAFLLLAQFRDFVRHQPPDLPGLRCVLSLEEAHRLLGENTEASPQEYVADPRAYVTRLAKNFLAEFRALNVGTCIFDQSAAQISDLIVKLAGTKIAFRQGDEADREVMGRAMLLEGSEREDLGRLRVGEAYVLADGYYRAQKIQTPVLEEVLRHVAPQ